MRFARVVFTVAGIYGLLVLLPQYFLLEKNGRDFPPAITHPEYYYGFVGVGVAWQIAFLLVARNPARYRALMPVAVVEKATFGIAACVLFARHHLGPAMLGAGLIDLFLGVLFTASFLVTGRAERQAARRRAEPVALDGPDAAHLLLERLAREHPDLQNRLSVEDAGGALLVKSGVPGRAEHELSVLLRETEATVAYSDGLAPGPAEKLFVWGDAPGSDGVEAVARFVDGLIRGETLLVRERIPLLARLIRGDGAGSLLWFVPAAEWAGWPPRRRRAIERAWAWSPDRKLAI